MLNVQLSYQPPSFAFLHWPLPTSGLSHLSPTGSYTAQGWPRVFKMPFLPFFGHREAWPKRWALFLWDQTPSDSCLSHGVPHQRSLLRPLWLLESPFFNHTPLSGASRPSPSVSGGLGKLYEFCFLLYVWSCGLSLAYPAEVSKPHGFRQPLVFNNFFPGALGINQTNKLNGSAYYVVKFRQFNEYLCPHYCNCLKNVHTPRLKAETTLILPNGTHVPVEHCTTSWTLLLDWTASLSFLFHTGLRVILVFSHINCPPTQLSKETASSKVHNASSRCNWTVLTCSSCSVCQMVLVSLKN